MLTKTDKILCVLLAIFFVLFGLSFYVPVIEKYLLVFCKVFGFVFVGAVLLLILYMILDPFIELYYDWDKEDNKFMGIIGAIITSILIAIGLLIDPFS
ncbi:hypothetical protein [uncultured Phascolarctobacterium sp.]|jgi:hypothetical protein|uniref:Uncharacterized protein n=1 Tax=Caudovirales sp. ctIZM3 TaxID=2827633 RepID=A0A8S5T8M2_9CAUD|nr:hypothetical protein [uncultured Phascolarctobacterium sp.]DAF59472.1 MAG TPA: hypothetical protein [Caudovirales sp. ctIZM3]